MISRAETHAHLGEHWLISIGDNPRTGDIDWLEANDNWELHDHFVHSCGSGAYWLTPEGPKCINCGKVLSSHDWPGD